MIHRHGPTNKDVHVGFLVEFCCAMTNRINPKSAANDFVAIASVLETLFPTACAVAVRDINPFEHFADLPNVERTVVQHALPKRRSEFAAGRAAARAALSALGIPAQPIPASADRAPEWPAGTAGSIAHTDGCAVAVAARTDHVLALGVDIELSGVLTSELWSQVLCPAEIERLRQMSSVQQTSLATVAFCAKEAYFKLQFPLTRKWINFTDAEVYILPGDQSFAVVAKEPLRFAAEEPHELTGGFAFCGGYTLVGMSLVRLR